MARRHLFTSESVTEGHPDKLADQISDAVLDAIVADDPNGRVACETLVTTGLVVVAGEISTETYVDIPAVVRRTITDIGYTDSRFGIDGDTCGVVTSIQDQSPDIAAGVDHAEEERDEGSRDPLDRVGAGLRVITRRPAGAGRRGRSPPRGSPCARSARSRRSPCRSDGGDRACR